MLNYEFLNRESNVEWEGIVNKLIEATRFGDIVSPDINIQHKVNTLYHIEDFVDHSKDVRGSLIEIDKNSQETLDTFNINDVNEWISKLLAIKMQVPHKMQEKLLF